jgi:hypothetical protein
MSKPAEEQSGQKQDAVRRTLMQQAERLLSDLNGAPVTLSAPQALRENHRNSILRCRVQGIPETSLILKAEVGENEHAYRPENDVAGSPAWRFFNEWAGTLFLNRQGGPPPHCARLIAGSRTHGILLLEDLGDEPSLASVVQEDDPTRAEAALLSYAAALGRMHADTLGARAEWRRVRQEIGGTEAEREPEGRNWMRENVALFGEVCFSLIQPASNFDAEALQVQQILDVPGPFDAFTPQDACPDNHRLMPDGSLRFFDFEGATYRHALLDAAYLHTPFPTCWCVNRLPKDLPVRLETAYRTELRRGCEAADDDALFGRHLAAACAYWTISTVSWGIKGDLEEDHTWGLASTRQRHLLRLDNFVAISQRFGQFPALAETCGNLGGKLRSLWPPEANQMPVYPAFRSEARREH